MDLRAATISLTITSVQLPPGAKHTPHDAVRSAAIVGRHTKARTASAYVGILIDRNTFGMKQAVIQNIDIYRSAAVLIEHHGKDAPIHAAMRADKLLAAGDIEGRAVWIRIGKAVDALLLDLPESSSQCH